MRYESQNDNGPFGPLQLGCAADDAVDAVDAHSTALLPYKSPDVFPLLGFLMPYGRFISLLHLCLTFVLSLVAPLFGFGGILLQFWTESG